MINFSEALVILTSNAAKKELMNSSLGFGARGTTRGLDTSTAEGRLKLNKVLEKDFPSEFWVVSPGSLTSNLSRRISIAISFMISTLYFLVIFTIITRTLRIIYPMNYQKKPMICLWHPTTVITALGLQAEKYSRLLKILSLPATTV